MGMGEEGIVCVRAYYAGAVCKQTLRFEGDGLIGWLGLLVCTVSNRTLLRWGR